MTCYRSVHGHVTQQDYRPLIWRFRRIFLPGAPRDGNPGEWARQLHDEVRDEERTGGLITMGRVTERRRVIRVRNGAAGVRPDTLVAEEPLEIRLNGKPLAITMRTPGDDFALAVGFLVSEGVLGSASDVRAVTYCEGAAEDGTNTYNVVNVQLAPGVPVPDITLERNVYTTSSCGLCGKASLDAVRTATRFPLRPGTAEDALRIPAQLLGELPDRLRRPRRSSTAPAACTRPGCSRRRASCWTYGRTSAATTPWTRSSAGRSRPASYRWREPCCWCRAGPPSNSRRRR